MTKLERLALLKSVEANKGVSITSVTYEEHNGVLHRKEELPFVEVNRLMDSPDYRAGYKYAHQKMAETIEFVLTAKPKDLQKYIGRFKPGHTVKDM